MSSVNEGEWWPSQRCTCTTFRPRAKRREGDRVPEGVKSGPPDARLLARGAQDPVVEVVGVEHRPDLTPPARADHAVGGSDAYKEKAPLCDR